MRPVTADWLGRRHTFRLPLAGLFAIEDETGKPAWTVLGDMLAGAVRMEQLEAVLFHGLLGAGTSIADAAAALDDTRRSGGQVAVAVALCIAVLANALDVPQSKGGGEGEPFNRKTAYRSGFAGGLFVEGRWVVRGGAGRALGVDSRRSVRNPVIMLRTALHRYLQQ